MIAHLMSIVSTMIITQLMNMIDIVIITQLMGIIITMIISQLGNDFSDGLLSYRTTWLMSSFTGDYLYYTYVYKKRLCIRTKYYNVLRLLLLHVVKRHNNSLNLGYVNP